MEKESFDKKSNALSDEEKKNFEDFKNKFDSLCEDEKKKYLDPLFFFLNQKAKEKQIKELHPIDQKALFTIIMVISAAPERLIKKIENDPEFVKIYNLFQESDKVESIHPDLITIYNNNITNAIEHLNLRKNHFKKLILSDQYDNFINIENSDRDNKDEICNRIFEGCKNNRNNKEIVEKYELVEKEISLLQNKVHFDLYDDMLKVKVRDTDILRYYSFLVFKPLQISIYETLLDDQWNDFPLKWFCYHSPAPEMKTLFDMFKEGEDISPYFVSRFNEDGLENLITIIDNSIINPPFIHVFCGIRDKIKEAIKCYREKLFASTIYTALPMIEGILWSYSIFLDHSGIKIYKENSDHNILIGKDNGAEIEGPTIGSLLKLSRFGEYFDLDFIDYFCDELYNERNPILHGKELDFDNHINAANKIGTIEYIVTVIKDYVEKNIIDSYGKNIPPEIVDRLLKSRVENIYAQQNGPADLWGSVALRPINR